MSQNQKTCIDQVYLYICWRLNGVSGENWSPEKGRQTQTELEDNNQFLATSPEL